MQNLLFQLFQFVGSYFVGLILPKGFILKLADLTTLPRTVLISTHGHCYCRLNGGRTGLLAAGDLSHVA